MVMPAAAAFATGPEIGELFPDFTLPDQRGNPVSFSAARGDKRAMIVIYRSASW